MPRLFYKKKDEDNIYFINKRMLYLFDTRTDFGEQISLKHLPILLKFGWWNKYNHLLVWVELG